MKIQFNEQAQVAIYKVADMMANADGVFLEEEKECIEEELNRIGVVNANEVKKQGEAIDALDALNTISKFDDYGKKYVSAFLGKLMSVDGDIADAELALWRFLCYVCKLPTMTNRQAINIINDL